jgi:tripartite-type tricarboxylate transporter receptor subunit TctC
LKFAGLQMNLVPYPGIAPAFQDVVAGHVGMVSTSPVEVKPDVGGLTSRGSTSPAPSAPLHCRTCFATETLSMPPVITWNGLLAPATAPHGVIDAVSTEIMAAQRDPQFTAQREKLGVDPIAHTPAEFAALNAADAERWRSIITELGIKPNRKDRFACQ